MSSTLIADTESSTRQRQLSIATMQRHWEGAFVVRDEMDKRFRELSSVAMLARRDIDRHIWLSECRPDLVPSAPAPPGVQRVVETKISPKKKKKKKSADGAKTSSRRTYSCRGIDDMARSSGQELSDLLRFFSTLDIDLQKLLLEAITKHSSKKTTKKKNSVEKEGCRSDQDVCEHQPRQLRRNSCTVRPNPCPSEDESPCSFREWTHFSKQQQSRGNEKFSTEEFSSSRAEWASSPSCRLTNSSGRARGGCGKMDAEDGVCRDVSVQTRRVLSKASKLNHKARDQSWEVAKSFGTAGRLLADQSAQTSLRGELTRADHFEEDSEKQREETTINVLERWAEPLEQYLSTLQKFEQELREKWLNPEEIETTSSSGAQTGDLESLCIQLTCDSLRASETQLQRISPDEVETQPGKPLSNKKFGGAPGDDVMSRPQLTHDGGRPLLDNLKQENFATHESGVITTPKLNPELREPDEHFHRARPESAASGSLHGKPKPEYLAAGFRTRKLVEWWPTDKPLQTTKSKSGPSIFSVYDPRTLLGKTKREHIPAEKPSVKPCKKPEWWPALRRPYSASEIEAMRQKVEDTAKATRKSPSKIFSGYRARRPPTQSSNKSQRRKTQEIETNSNQCTPECMAQHDDDSLKRTVQMQIPQLRLPPRKSDQKAKELGQEMQVSQKAHKHCQNLSTVGESEQSNVKKSSKYKTGHGGLHALQEHSQLEMQRISNTVEDQVCGMITQLEDQVCGSIMTQLQPEQESEVASNLRLHQLINSPREADIQAGVLSQANVQKELQKPPMVAPVVDIHNEQHEVEKKRNKRNPSNISLQRGIERLADKLIDQAVNEVASELAEFCETVADQMYTAEFVT